MNEASRSSRLRRSARICLSSRGYSTEAAYRADVAAARGGSRRESFERARGEWATAHGLEPDDGAYLSELAGRSLTLGQLGEALAICAQSQQMVTSTVGRLVTGGFIDRLDAGDRGGARPSVKAMALELGAASDELAFLRGELELGAASDRRVVSGILGTPLRQALARVVVARRMLARMLRHS